jgi:hypothetical protein
MDFFQQRGKPEIKHFTGDVGSISGFLFPVQQFSFNS